VTLLAGAAVLDEARTAGRAVPGFVAYNLETAQGIVTAAERAGRPVLIQAGSSAFGTSGFRPLALLALELARLSPAPVGVHLDHCRDRAEITACIDLGYTSVMVDGSHLPFAANAALTAEVVQEAHAAGVWVEAELGAVAGDEDVSTDAASGTMTDPEQAREFVAATGVDALAVAVGNVHGFTRTPPAIDLPRLERIREAAGVPLVLHGASGLAPEVLLACVARGVAKVNVNTELRHAYLGATEVALPAARAGADLAAVLRAGREAVADTATRITRLLAPA
jgi:tagatose 1,6-diphosphate aldolase GatY/KbaY